MEKALWTPTAGWMVAIGAAFALAQFAPDERALLGRVPTVSAKRLDQRQMALPHGLPAERTLAVVLFRRDQKAEAQSWIDGMQLRTDRSIPWVKMPVLEDPGTEPQRRAIEHGLLARVAHPHDRSQLVLLFTDREAFVRSAQLPNSDHAAVLVLDRRGTVLARADGAFDEDKAQALRETLLAQD
jgi:hypothetical protein